MDMDSGIKAACICPHPPLLVPAIGGSELARVKSTVRAMRELADELGRMGPQVLVFISPHTPVLPGSFTVKTSSSLQGDFSMFGHPEVSIVRDCDLELSLAILNKGKAEGLPIEEATGEGRGGWVTGRRVAAAMLDHGVMVPLYYLSERIDTPLVSLSISFLPYEDHRRLGAVVRSCCEDLGRKAVFVASGDLSHRLIPGAPAGYSPRGKDFDRAICSIAEKGSFELLDDLPEDLVEDAGECGLRSFYAMHGALRGYSYQSRLLSYEGPFGVGYLVSLHEVTG